MEKIENMLSDNRGQCETLVKKVDPKVATQCCYNQCCSKMDAKKTSLVDKNLKKVGEERRYLNSLVGNLLAVYARDLKIKSLTTN